MHTHTPQVCDAAAAQSRAYARLEHLCVEFGHRLAGSATFDRCAEWACAQMRDDGLENVRMEPVPTEVRLMASALRILIFG
jgi:hypothetical protein